MTLQRRLRDPFHAGTGTAICREAADRIDALERENAALRKEVERVRTQVVLPQQQALYELKADADRYRWMKDRATSAHEQQGTSRGIHYPTTWRVVTGGSDISIDAAIDAAMEQR